MKFSDFLKGCGLGLLSALSLTYYTETKPAEVDRSRLVPLKEKLIAHRGLFDLQDKPENSLPAFRAAVENDYGIELDVQMTKDGKLVVFHDDNLIRMCGVDKILTDCDYDELSKYVLINSKEHIPTFSSVLEVIDGKVPLLVEIKQSGDYLNTTKKVIDMLHDYSGYFCILSFSPLVLKTVREEDPSILRGQLSTDYFIDYPQMDKKEKFKLSYLLEDRISQPSFVIYNYEFMDKASYRLLKCFHPDLFTAVYTIKDQAKLEAARKIFDCYIFDNFIPDKK